MTTFAGECTGPRQNGEPETVCPLREPNAAGLKVSLITACLNPGETIREALSSVWGQGYPNIEVVVVDGGSTDGTLAYLHSHRSRIDRFRSGPDGGIYDALNRGLALARGDIIGFVHADDMLADTDTVARVVRAFDETEADITYGDIVYVSRSRPDHVLRYWRSGAYQAKLLRRGWMPPHPSFFSRREVFERVAVAPGRYFDTTFRIAADYDFMLRALQLPDVRVGYIPETLARMRVGGVSNRSPRQMAIKSCEDYRIIRRHGLGGLSTLLAKNVRKLPQFLRRQPESGRSVMNSGAIH